MELSPTQLANLQAITLTSSKVRLDNLSVGQQLLAKVISTSTTGDVTLSINNAILNAKAAVALTEGQLLKLVVAQTGKQIVLQLPQKVLNDALTQQVLRESLPKQQPLNQTVSILQQTLKQASQLNLPQKVTQSLQNFVNRLPTPEQLSNGKSLREVVKNSGIFLEKTLSQALPGQTKIAGNDLKALMTQLKNVLTVERNAANQLPQSSQEIKPQQLQQTLANATLQNQLQKQDVAKAITAQTLLDQKQTKQTNATANINAQSASIKATTQQIDAALKIKADQAATQSLSQSKTQSPNTSQLQAPPPLAPLTKTGLTPPLQATTSLYNTGRQATSIKEALAINFPVPVNSSDSAGLVSRFTNLIELLDQLIRQVESSLARTQLHQLNTLQDQDSGKLAWSMEIPVQQEDETHLVKLDIEKESDKQEGEAAVTVNLAVNLESLGPVYARITLVGNNVSVVFWAEQEYTFTLANNSVHELQSNLEKSGFQSPKINCHHGQPPQLQLDAQNIPDKLLDIKV